ncbi:MAG: hypothetical protein ACKESB_03845 [Candidatus Hodgkinia cicadicola]
MFGCRFANVLSPSDSQMNQAVLSSPLLSVGDTIMGLILSVVAIWLTALHVYLSDTWFNAVAFGVDVCSGLIDMNEVLNCVLRSGQSLCLSMRLRIREL